MVMNGEREAVEPGRRKGGPDVVFACVTEANRKFLDQSARLLLSLRWFGGAVADAPFVLGCMGTLPPQAERFFRHFGAHVVPVERFDAAHGPSNKIGLIASAALAGHEVVALLDCDTVVVGDPSPWLTVEGMAAKTADMATVTHEDLAAIFRHFELPVPAARYVHELGGEPCLAYCNSGVIVVRGEFRERLAADWARWNRALLDAPEALRFNRYHTDQASLALAIEGSGIPFQPLPSEMNMPAHLEERQYPAGWQSRDPLVVHYHWLAQPDGFLKKCALRQTTRRMEAFNARLRAEFAAVSAEEAPPPESHPKVVVGSGWWCDETPHDWTIGAPSTRTVAFFELWYRQVMRCLRPAAVVVTDSASPIKPDHARFERLQWVELDRNYGHANDIRLGRIATRLSGFTRSVLTGAMHALCCDADYYVYVEQDCLVTGEDFLAAAIGDAEEEILIGQRTENGRGLGGGTAAAMMQQSLMVVKRSALPRFIAGIASSPWTDGEKSPEEIMRLRLQPGTVRIPYGRSRPIDFERSAFYAQHLDEEELDAMLRRVGASRPDETFAFGALADPRRL